MRAADALQLVMTELGCCSSRFMLGNPSVLSAQCSVLSARCQQCGMMQRVDLASVKQAVVLTCCEGKHFLTRSREFEYMALTLRGKNRLGELVMTSLFRSFNYLLKGGTCTFSSPARHVHIFDRQDGGGAHSDVCVDRPPAWHGSSKFADAR